MRRKPHGILSMALFFLVVLIGLFSILQSSAAAAIIYLFLVILSFLLIVYSFCSKCPYPLQCSHILPGRMAALLPERSKGKYHFPDIAGVIVAFLIILVFPQFWLAKNLPLLCIFWILTALVFIEIRLKVCRSCAIKYCPLKPSYKK